MYPSDEEKSCGILNAQQQKLYKYILLSSVIYFVSIAIELRPQTLALT